MLPENNKADNEKVTTALSDISDAAAKTKQLENMVNEAQEAIRLKDNALKSIESILNSIDINIYATIPDTGELLFVNDLMRKMFGIEDMDITGKYCYEIFRVGFNAKCDFCPCYKLDKDPDAKITWDEYFEEPDLHVRHTDCYIDWHDGRKVHLQYAADVTDIFKAQESLTSMATELQQSNERLMLMLDTYPMSAEIWNKEHKLIDCNEAGVKAYGFKDKQEYMDRFTIDCFPEYQPNGKRSADLAEENLQTAFKYGYHVFDWSYKMPRDDTPIPSEVILVRTRYKDEEVVIGYMRDLREYENAAKEIEYRDKIMQAVNQSAVLLLTTQDNENIETPLSTGMELIGHSIDVDRIHIWQITSENGKEDIIHSYCWCSEIGKQKKAMPTGLSFPFGDNPDWDSDFRRGESISGPVSAMKKGAKEFFTAFDVISIVMIPLIINEQFWGLFTVDDCVRERDFTKDEVAILKSLSLMMASAINRRSLSIELKEAQEKAMERLEKLVEERTQELALLKDAADVANKAKSSFLANMSHEIRTPMNAILGVADILMQKEALPDDVEDGLGRIYNSCDILLSIINDLLDFSKIEAGKMDLNREQYKIANMISDSIQLNMMWIDDKPIEFEIHIDENTPAKLYGDEMRIKQILNNLLSNAFKYTNSGSVSLTVVSEHWPEKDGVTLVLIIKDTGVGMTKDQLANLFQEYLRFNEKSAYGVEGTGLGLAITNGLVSMMNGGLTVESEPDVGSTFIVRLPQETVDNDVIGKDIASSLEKLRMNYVVRKKRGQVIREQMPYGKVLVVDDMEPNLYVATGLLRPYDLQIETATSGYEVIDLIEAGKEYDLIFMDHMMPELDGIETTKKLRDSGYSKPIVALTANAVIGQESIFLKNGFDVFISKPVDIRQLNSVLNKYVRDAHPEEATQTVQKPINDEAEDNMEPYSGPLAQMQGKIIGLDIMQGVEQYSGNEKYYTQVLTSYTASVRTILDEIKKVTKDTLPEYKIKVHSIKGASDSIFANRVASLAGNLEQAAKDNDFEYVEKNNKEFIETAGKLIDDIDTLLSEVDSESEKPVKDKPDNELLSGLIEACKTFSINEVEDIMEKIDSYKYESDDGLAAWLREKTTIMNYTLITEKLTELLRE